MNFYIKYYWFHISYYASCQYHFIHGLTKTQICLWMKRKINSCPEPAHLVRIYGLCVHRGGWKFPILPIGGWVPEGDLHLELAPGQPQGGGDNTGFQDRLWQVGRWREVGGMRNVTEQNSDSDPNYMWWPEDSRNAANRGDGNNPTLNYIKLPSGRGLELQVVYINLTLLKWLSYNKQSWQWIADGWFSG